MSNRISIVRLCLTSFSAATSTGEKIDATVLLRFCFDIMRGFALIQQRIYRPTLETCMKMDML